MLNIKQLRKKAGKTLRDMAELCNVSTSTYQRWEKTPDDIPHALWLEIVEYLEIAIQVKEQTMYKVQHLGDGCAFIDPQDGVDDWDNLHVPVPEGLTHFFEPSRPVTNKQVIAWATRGIEPYPGYAEEEHAWDVAHAKLAAAERRARGIEDVVVKMPSRTPDHDEEGNYTDYDEPELVVEEQEDGSDKYFVKDNRPDEDSLLTQEKLYESIDEIPMSDDPYLEICLERDRKERERKEREEQERKAQEGKAE